MNQLFQHKFKNRILAALPKEEIERLLPRLSPVTLKLKQPLDGGVNYAYLIEEGIASVVVSMEDGTTVETGLIGKDGVVGIPMLLGAAQGMPADTFIQVEGSGFRIDGQFLKQEFERPGTLRSQIEKFVLANLVQSSQSAACNRVHPIAERLARWLLTCHDRIEVARMPLDSRVPGADAWRAAQHSYHRSRHAPQCGSHRVFAWARDHQESSRAGKRSL